jgi:hypothetical protein
MVFMINELLLSLFFDKRVTVVIIIFAVEPLFISPLFMGTFIGPLNMAWIVSPVH